MTTQPAPDTSTRRVAMGIVGFIGLSQGAVPLVARGVFGRDERFAPALRLPAPWWWIACIAISVAALVVLAMIDKARQRRGPTEPADSPGAPPAAPERAVADSGGYDALSALVFLVGVYNGIAPFIARLIFDGDLLLAFPLRLPAPWWWITSLAVLAVALALLILIDNAKKAAHPDE